MLFGFVFMEKNAKNKKKKHGTFQNLLHHISTMEALQNITQTDSGSYSEGVQLSFFDLIVLKSEVELDNFVQVIKVRKRLKWRM